MALAATESAGIPPATAVDRISRVDEVSGRFARFGYHGTSVRLLLAKNPASWLETFEFMADTSTVLLAFNARDLDGLDTSWIWDVSFGLLRTRRVFVTGERKYDIAARLSYDMVSFTVVDSINEICFHHQVTHLDVVANYTAFLSLTALLRNGK
jgi:UDP-N-acetylmuramyl tripeptide synthase